MLANHPQVRQGKQSDHLCRILRQSTETHLRITKLTLDHPERMFNLGPHLGLGLFDFTDRVVNRAALTVFLVSAAPCCNLPDHIPVSMLFAFFDTGITGVDKRPEHQDRKMIWSIAARPSSYKKHKKNSLIGRLRRKIEYAKAQVRAKVEHPFRVIKRQFGYTKVRFRGLMKNTAQQATLFALSNLWMMRKRLLVVGEVRL